MEKVTDSLTIEILGLKATALGIYPVSLLILFMAAVVLSGAFVGPAKLSVWAKWVAKWLAK
ncbi:hypothetical protein ACIQUG_08085 [Ensifer sp. NPDC090286]|uniref:hypothetical protein n=1 Tax=Ensifer sp. NPDC090286 TaxID=3363991 RepID=UPI00383B661C